MKIGKLMLCAVAAMLILVVGGAAYAVNASAHQSNERLAAMQLLQQRDHDAAAAAAAKARAAAAAARAAALSRAAATAKAKAASDLATAKKDAAEAKAQARANAKKPATVIYRQSPSSMGYTSVYGQPAGLLCRDLKAAGYGWSDAIDYWNYWNQPNSMDIDRNGIPCETVY